jgi:hypothetical protein
MAQSERWEIRALFSCQEPDCGWYDYNHRTAQSSAAAHARTTGHHMSGEVTTGVRYNHPSAEPEPKRKKATP